MKVLVAGATGVIGKVLVPLLIERGHDVAAIARTLSGRNALEAQRAAAFLCDVFDTATLSKVFEETRPDAVVNQLTSIPNDMHPRRINKAMRATNRLRCDGTRHLITAAQRVGTNRFVSQSIAFVYDPAIGVQAIEEDSLYYNAPKSFASVVGAVRRCEYQTLHAQGIAGLVLRYGYFYGPGTIYSRVGTFGRKVLHRQVPIMGQGTGRFSFIHVADAAAATVQALEAGTPGIYNICDDEPAAVADWLPYYAKALGAAPPRKAPAWLGRLVGGPYLHYMMVEQPGASNALAKKTLGWQPRYSSWREGFREL